MVHVYLLLVENEGPADIEVLGWGEQEIGEAVILWWWCIPGYDEMLGIQVSFIVLYLHNNSAKGESTRVLRAIEYRSR